MKGGGRSHSSYTREIGNDQGSIPAADNCDFINFVTELQNLQPSLLQYALGDILEVTLLPNDNVGAVGDHGLCGYITAVETTKLIICLKKGKKFKAAIQKISQNLCEVRVRPLN